MADEARAARMALVVKSDTFEDLLLALSWAGIAHESEMDVSLFFTNRRRHRLRRDRFADALAVATPGDVVEAQFIDGAEQMGFTDLRDLLRQVKATGRVRSTSAREVRGSSPPPDALLPDVDSVP